MQLRDWTVRFGSPCRAGVVSALPGRVLPIWERASSSRTRHAHLSRVLQHRTSNTGMFGLKLQPDQLTRWFGTFSQLQQMLGPLQVIRLRRDDRHAQVESFTHAIRTGQWSATDTPSRIRLPVSRRWAEGEIDRQERRLDRLIRGVPVHAITTEALISDFNDTLRSVLAFLGDAAAAPLPLPGQDQQVRD